MKLFILRGKHWSCAFLCVKNWNHNHTHIRLFYKHVPVSVITTIQKKSLNNARNGFLHITRKNVLSICYSMVAHHEQQPQLCDSNWEHANMFALVLISLIPVCTSNNCSKHKWKKPMNDAGRTSLCVGDTQLRIITFITKDPLAKLLT